MNFEISVPKERAAIENVEFRKVGMLGDPRVNVLRLNLALDANSPKTVREH